MADAGNGITDFFAQVGNFGRVNTDELCVGSTCVSEDEFKALLAGTAAGAPLSGQDSGTPSGPSAPLENEAETDITTTAGDAATSTPPAASDAEAQSSTDNGAGNEPDDMIANVPPDDSGDDAATADEPQPEAVGEPAAPVVDTAPVPAAANDNPPPPSAEAI